MGLNKMIMSEKEKELEKEEIKESKEQEKEGKKEGDSPDPTTQDGSQPDPPGTGDDD